tara:strand:+ start:499 stop:798 length:300 start_codon:yes stop_codon:yes gene_type:complete
MISKAQAILAIKSDALISTDSDNKVIWHDGNPSNITDKQIEDKQKELQTDYDNNKYQRDRALAYPSIQDQLDMQYWDSLNGTTTWKDAIAKVKSDNKKP